MAGILDFLQQPDAQLGIGLLAAGGPTTDPNQTGFGQRLAGAMNSVTANQQIALRAKLMQSQMDENDSQALYRKSMTDQMARKLKLQQDFWNGLPSGAAPADVAASTPIATPAVYTTPAPGSRDPMIRAVATTESNNNPNAVSPKGAQGTMQVMPGTNTSPGFGVTPARDGSEGERTRVGQDYLGAMLERYKDPALAAIAYNWGPGNTDMWLKSGGDYAKLPQETKQYVSAVLTRNGVNGRAGQPPVQAPAQPVQAMPTSAVPRSGLGAMTPTQIAQGMALDVLPAGSEKLWEIDRFGRSVQPGYIQDANGNLRFTGDLTKGLDSNGRLTQGYIADQASLSGATKGAEANATFRNSALKLRGADGSEITTTPAQAEAAGMSQPGGGFKTGASSNERGSEAFNTKMATEQGDILTKGYTSANDAVSNIQGIQESRKAMQAGAFQGTGADAKLAVVKFGAALGYNIDPEKATNTDYLKSTLGNGLLEKAKTLGSNPSNADASRITDIVGSIGKDPGAMAKILDWQEEQARKAINQHNTKVDQASANGFKSQFDMHVKPPEASADAQKQPNVLNELPKTAPVGKRLRDTETGKIMRFDGLKWKEE